MNYDDICCHGNCDQGRACQQRNSAVSESEWRKNDFIISVMLIAVISALALGWI